MGALVLLLALAGCGGATDSPSASSKVALSFKSPVLVSGKTIPSRYKCDVANSWLPLRWGALPAGTGELAIYVARFSNLQSGPNGSKRARLLAQALIVGLKPTLHELPAGKLPHGALVGEYEAGTEHIPFCPPHDASQSFLFELYALPGHLNINKGTQGGALLNKLNSESLGAGTFSASYAKT